MLDPDLSSLSAIAVYAVVWGFLFAECGLLLGFLLPGDTILFGAGLLAAAPSSGVDIVVLVVGAFVAAVAGNEVGYRTGRRFGRSWVEARESGRALEQLRRTERFYDRYGWFSVVVARWIPWVRTFLPIVAGTAAMRRTSFTSANLVGALSWAVALPIVGYYAYRFPTLRTIAFTIAGIFITVSLVGLAVMLVRDAVRRRREKRAAPTAPRESSDD
ncbi:MAG TPA: DedA family protein [Candidatus Nanopelagicales bacterium]|nr:DedA family protein [Candidatus Nanopelagicales bacterium]